MRYLVYETQCFHVSVSALTRHTSVMGAKYRIFGFSGFSENVDFGDYPAGFGIWEGLQSIGNGGGLQMDGFSAHFEPYGFIFSDFQDVDHFVVDSGGLRLFPEGPRTLQDRPEGPGAL